MLNDKLFFFEQTDFSLRFARCVISETSLHIEELKEVSISDATALTALAPAGTQVVCALRPKPRQLHLASVDEAKKYAGLAGLQQFAQLPFTKGEPAWFSGVQASDGAIPANAPWLMSMSSAAAHQQACAAIEALKLKPARCLDATLATIGALTSTVTSPTLLLEIGELGSLALLIGHDGVVAARGITLNLDQIADAVQTELALKFRGSAAKLFFNPDCDFTDSGPKIAARLAAALKADLAPLFVGHTAPATLCCAGLPAMQHWLALQLATVLGLSPHIPDVKAWSAAVGVTFGTPELGSNVSPAWFNFLHFINSQTLESPVAVAWQAEWLSLKAPIAAKPATTPAVAAGSQRPTKTTTTPPIPVPVPTPAVAAKPAQTPAKPAPAPTALKPTPVAAAQVKPTAAPAAPVKPTPAPVAKPAAAATPTPAKAPVSSVQYSAKPSTSTAPTSSGKSSGNKSKMPIFIGIGALVLALAGGGFFYVQSQNEDKARIALDKQKAEQRAKEEADRAHLAEQKAQQEAASRKKLETESAQKLALAEAARVQAEGEARAQTASRLANARGTLFITTQPAGATVTVADLPPRSSPATFAYLKIGKYPITITLAHHEEVKLELEVTENNTTTSDTIQLASLVGSVAITSEPAGSAFEIRPANSFTVTSDARRTGQTPANLDDLDPGDYTVTFTRPGWAPHSETVSVARNATAKVAWAFPSGTVKITSSPTGATVTQDGVKLGLTPLTLRQPPGAVKYELKLAFHDPVTLPGVIEEGKTAELSAQLPLTDIVFGPTELDQMPSPINPKTPDLPSSLTLVEGKVVIQMTIGRDGTPTDLKIVRASNPEIGKIYLAALAKWKFKPGIKDGKPVRSAVVVPFLINPSKD